MKKYTAFIFAAICLVLLLIIPNRICQYICVSVISIILLSYFYSLILRKNIKIERSITELKLASREKVEISFTIKNTCFLPAFVFYFFDDVPYLYVFDEKNSGLTTLRPYEIKKVTYTISARDRGKYSIGPVKVKSSDPLSLFDFDLEIPSTIDVTVRPARIKLITETIPGFPQGSLKIKNPCYEDITMHRSIREYKNGDEQKRINWRASAKFDSLFTNQYEDSYDAPFFVFLNLAEDDYELQSRLYYTEKAIEMAACIVERSRFLKQRCGFAAYGSDFPYLKPAQNQSDAILNILSLIKTVPGKLNYNPVKKLKSQLPVGTLLFVIGPEQVMSYFAKVEKNKENINTTNVGALKK